MRETQTRKLGNLIIREGPKRTSKEEPNKTKTSMMSEQDKKRITQPKLDSNFELQKEFMKAENLSEEDQTKIRKEAERTVNKKAKSTEIKIQNEMISMLELECGKLGGEVEKEKLQNQKLRYQIGQLRKNIDYLNAKLENIYRDHDSLSKNNDYGKMEKEQLKEEIQKLRTICKRLQEEKEYQQKIMTDQLQSFKMDIQELKQSNETLLANFKCLKEEKEQVEEELQEKTNQYQYIRENFQEKKREWDRLKQDFESNSKQNLQKKGEKITKFQVQLQGLTDKLKQQESLRKKIIEKNKQLQKQLTKRTDTIGDLEMQIGTMKKRINDLSILKSSNNTIMSQKLTQLTEENAKLKKDVDSLQKKGVIVQEENSKPFLFGPEEDD